MNLKSKIELIKLKLDTSKFKKIQQQQKQLYNIKDEDFIKIVEESETYTEIGLKLGYDKYNNN